MQHKFGGYDDLFVKDANLHPKVIIYDNLPIDLSLVVERMDFYIEFHPPNIGPHREVQQISHYDAEERTKEGQRITWSYISRAFLRRIFSQDNTARHLNQSQLWLEFVYMEASSCPGEK